MTIDNNLISTHNAIVFKLSKSEFRGFSAVLVAAGQVFFGAFVGGVAVLALDPIKLFVLALELILSLFSWYLSVAF
ncbi:MAG: hypothetical protein CEO21_425 [Microgenomates group bacterium Gr01-1014_80]|nr:MAG: hypothetical protein CEO21_425 [Microgenomates group bacterium Gr01-1014_80]